HPDVPIILGGPQASVVDETTMESFPFIDFVLRGEADETLPQLIDALSTSVRTLTTVRGLTYRNANGRIVRSDSAPVIENLDALPLPAFHLDPEIKERGVLHLELGRGCPFACTFCATNDFFRRNFRLKSPARMLQQMRCLKQRYGISNFS